MSSFDERRPENRPPLPEDYEGEYRRGAVGSAPEMATKLAAGGSAAEVVAGIGTLALAILSWLGLMEITLMSVAMIAGGLGLLFHGTAVHARFTALTSAPSDRPADMAMRVVSPPAELFGGIAVTVMGFFALFGWAPMTLASVAAIVGGSALVLGSWATTQLNSYSSGYRTSSDWRPSTAGLAGGQALAGLGAIALGIFSRLGYWPLTLNQVAWVVLGATLLLVGTTFGARLMGMVGGSRYGYR